MTLRSLPLFFPLLQTDDDRAQQTAKFLSEVANDHFKQDIFEAGALQPLLDSLTNSQNPDYIRDGLGAVSSLLQRPTPPLSKDIFEKIFSVSVQFLHVPNEDTLSYVCDCLSVLSRTGESHEFFTQEDFIIPKV